MDSPVLIVPCHSLAGIKLILLHFFTVREQELGEVASLEFSILKNLKEVRELATSAKVPVVVHVEDWKLRVEFEICVVFLLDVDLFIGGDGADEQKPNQQCATNVKRV